MLNVRWPFPDLGLDDCGGMPSPNLVLHIPHSSRLIPPEERAQLTPDDRTLVTELLRMTDAFTDGLFAPTPFEAARVVFPVSRLVCDVERFPDDSDEPMALRGMGAVYVKTTNGQPLREHLTAAERVRVIETWYRPPSSEAHRGGCAADCRGEELHHRRLPQLLVATSAA
ncbi:N-formylglutamate amidohydrolase [Bradyrhizobium sp. DN5]|uniref:N-formylglutamate amidohydrolase n=1 Tax=Bradyrhizobium sp. DN5 TaxID=3056950 RepID=UPI0035239F91